MRCCTSTKTVLSLLCYVLPFDLDLQPRRQSIMSRLGSAAITYKLIGRANDGNEELSKVSFFKHPQKRRQWRFFCWWKSCVLLICLAMRFAVAIQVQDNARLLKPKPPSGGGQVSHSCKDAPTRREWRSLNKVDKLSYIAAVQCLRDSPSRIRVEQSMYDDFPWVYNRLGEYYK